MIILNKANFLQKIQHILENHYLQPLNASKKPNLKDGFIERPIHGAMHASRAALWVLAMHHFLQKLCPDYVNGAMEKIARHLNIEIEDLLLLILLTMVCHDAARKGEGQDLWEKESSQIAQKILVELGLDSNQAQLFSKAIQFKDQPQQYIAQLKECGIESQDYNAFAYIRSLINLGDNLDLMRCVGQFKAKFIFDTLKNIEGFDERLHEQEIMELLQEIQQIIYEQGDMLFACDILDQKGQSYAHHDAHIRNSIKVSYEHADNVLATLFADIAKNPKFQTLLTDLDVPKAQKYNLEPAFVPYIHGTNSSILSLLPKSNFEIKSPIEMMKKHQAAPMTGELTRGGYRNIETKMLGKTSFAKLSAQKLPGRENIYTLENVLANYTKLDVSLDEQNVEDFKAACERGFGQSYVNINLILIYFVRARQSGIALEEIINPEELKLLLEKMEGIRQFYYLLQLFGKYIFPNVAELNQFRIMQADKKFPEFTQEGEYISLAAQQFLTFENLVQKIIDNQLNIKEIIENPTEEQLNKVLDILQVPQKCTLEDEDGKINAENIELALTQFFSLKPETFAYVHDGMKRENLFKQMQTNNSSHRLLRDFIDGRASNDLFSSLSMDAKHFIEALEDRIQLFKNLINTPQSHFKISAMQEYFLERQFPIVLLSEAEEKIALIAFDTEEYRSHFNLKLGEDIKLMATDTHVHRLEILKYLELHAINNVQILLFSDLQNIKTNHQKMASPEHHSDGVPTLKWMAAKKLSKDNPSVLLEQSTQSSHLYSEKNVNEVKSLLQDAKTYQDIQFKPCCAYRCSTPTHHQAIDLLTQAGFKKNEFQSLVGYSAKDNIISAQLIIYLAELNLPQFYKKVLNDAQFKKSLTLLFEKNMKENISAELLSHPKFMELIYNMSVLNGVYSYGTNDNYLRAIIALFKQDPNLLDKQIERKLSDNVLIKLILYFEENKLQNYYHPLLKHHDLAWDLLWNINQAKFSNELIALILGNEDILQAIDNKYINLIDRDTLEAGFILSKQGIEINAPINYKSEQIIHRLNKAGFTDKSFYLKAINDKELIAVRHFIDTPLQISAVFKAHELGILNLELVCKMDDKPYLTQMFAFTKNKNEWDLCSQFYDLLEKLELQKKSLHSTNSQAYKVMDALRQDINKEIERCFSLANNDPNKIGSFSLKCNQMIEKARSILELNTGLIGILDSSLSFISYLNPRNLFASNMKANKTNHSFFKNESVKLVDNIKNVLEVMEKTALI